MVAPPFQKLPSVRLWHPLGVPMCFVSGIKSGLTSTLVSSAHGHESKEVGRNAFGFLTELVNFGAYDRLAWGPRHGAEEGRGDPQEPAPADCLSSAATPTRHGEDGRFRGAEERPAPRSMFLVGPMEGSGIKVNSFVNTNTTYMPGGRDTGNVSENSLIHLKPFSFHLHGILRANC